MSDCVSEILTQLIRLMPPISCFAGKTVSILALVTAYQYAHIECGKLVYATRTVQEMDKVMAELKRVIAYRTTVITQDAHAAHKQFAHLPPSAQSSQIEPNTVRDPSILGVCLSSRRNLCIHPQVSAFDNRSKVDALCRNLTAAFVREQKAASGTSDVETCSFFDAYELHGKESQLSGIYSLDDMKQFGQSKGWCPYFLARHLITRANVVVYNFQYLIDPKVAQLVSRDISNDSIVVCDESHNVDSVS